MSTRINLFSGPRNISTAMMYAFAQREDTTVVDEPLYAYYLHATGVEHPGKNEILITQEIDSKRVIRNVVLGDYNTDIVFFKQMTHHLLDIDLSFLLHTKNIILIRDPKKVLFSYYKIIQQPTLDDIGIKQSFELYAYIKKNKFHYIIIDSDEILKDPETALKKICASCEIQFEEKMLRWQAGERKEDGVWAKYWYKNVHESTGFEEYKKQEVILPHHLMQVYNEALVYYEKLLNIK